jgi:hypothetical protein
MTTAELKLEYKRDTGNYAENNERDYTNWLESQLLFIRTALCITERALEKLKQMEDELRG